MTRPVVGRRSLRPPVSRILWECLPAWDTQLPCLSLAKKICAVGLAGGEPLLSSKKWWPELRNSILAVEGCAGWLSPPSNWLAEA